MVVLFLGFLWATLHGGHQKDKQKCKTVLKIFFFVFFLII